MKAVYALIIACAVLLCIAAATAIYGGYIADVRRMEHTSDALNGVAFGAALLGVLMGVGAAFVTDLVMTAAAREKR